MWRSSGRASLITGEPWSSPAHGRQEHLASQLMPVFDLRAKAEQHDERVVSIVFEQSGWPNTLAVSDELRGGTGAAALGQAP